MTLLLLAFGCLTMAHAQSVTAKMDELTAKWDTEAEKLSTYAGLSQFCTSAAYRNDVISTLKGIHHYDSMVYDIISKKAKYGNASDEIKKTLKDIEKVQTEYSMKSFLVFLSEECKARSEIEKNAKQTGEDKDAEVYVLETELAKYVKHITKQIDLIDDHIHHLNIN